MAMTEEQIQYAKETICMMRHRIPAVHMSDPKYRKRIAIDRKLAAIKDRKAALEE